MFAYPIFNHMRKYLKSTRNVQKGFRCFIFLFALLLACGGYQQQSENIITYWSSNNTDEIEFARTMVREWNALNPQLPVHFQPVPEGRSSEEIILAAVVGKTTPDIYSNMWQGDVELYAQAGVLVALDTLPGFREFLESRCDSQTIREVTSRGGHIYQVPWKINPIMMMYNKKYLEGIGFADPPATYSEYLVAGERFQQDSDSDGYVDRWIGYSEVLVAWWQRFFDFYTLYLAASGGAPLVQNNQIVFDNQYAVQVFTFLRELYEKNYFSTERLSGRMDPFLAKSIATRFVGPWEIMHAERFKPEGLEYDFAPVPVPDGHTGPVYTYGDPKNIVIFKTCKNPRAAWRFIRFMIERENDLKFLKITNQLPRRKGMLNDSLFASYFQQNPKMIPFARQAEFIRGTDVSPVLKEIFDAISREYEACVIYGVKSPKEAIADAARASRLLLK
ncbi:MAG: extracellular solute-binding protein [Calditrichia bacterium]